MATVAEPEVLSRHMLPHSHAVLRQLGGARRLLRRHLLCEGLAWSVGVTALMVAASYIADRWLRFETSARLALLPIGVAALLAVAYFKLIRPLLLRLHDLDLAVVIDRRVPGYGERVANVLQLPALLRNDPAASPSMIEAAVLQQAGELQQIDLGEKFNRQRLFALAAAIVVPLIVLGAAALVWPDAARLWAKRWLAGSSARWPQHTYLSVVGLGDSDRLYVPRGESIMVEVDASPAFVRETEGWGVSGRGASLRVAQKDEPQSVVPDEVRIAYLQAGAKKLGALTQFTANRFRYELPPVDEAVSFTLYGGDDWLGPLTIEPLNRPGIEDLKIVSRAPGRDESETHTFGGQESHLLFLPNTKLELSLTSDVPLESAQLVAATGAVPRLERRDDRHYTAEWLMSEAQTLEIKLVDAAAGLTSKPYFVTLNLLQDRLPRVVIRSSGVGRRVTPQATIPVALRAMDDFGLATVGLDAEETIVKDEKPVSATHAVPIPLPTPTPGRPLTEIETDHRVSLKEYALAAGATLKLRGTATDNRAEEAQGGQSRWLTFQVVTPEELFYEILMVQRAQREKFRATLEVEKAQLTALETVADAEQLAAITRKHQVAARQVWQVANRLEATLQEITLNDLGSQQARELLSTGIIAPLRALHDTAMGRVRTLFEQMTADPSRIPEQAPAAREAQQEVVDQMTSILSRMAQWESFVDVLNQVRQIMQLQNRVLESTEKTRLDRTNDIFDE